MDKLSGIATVFIVISGIGAVGFAVYYSFFNKMTPKKVEQYVSYVFLIYLGFPLSIVLALLLSLAMQRDYYVAANWASNDFYISIVIVFGILLAITLRFIWNDIAENKYYQERETVHRLKRANFMKNNPGYVQCEYCGSWVDENSPNCAVCGVQLRPAFETETAGPNQWE